MVMFTGAAPALLEPSVTYLKIRAWSAPAVLISMVAQVIFCSGCASQDAVPPGVSVPVGKATAQAHNLPATHMQSEQKLRSCQWLQIMVACAALLRCMLNTLASFQQEVPD